MIHDSSPQQPVSPPSVPPAPVDAARQVYIKTFGCQMNVYDSERMAEALQVAGYRQTDSPENADLLLLNTCHIREKAVEKVYSELGRLAAIVEIRKRRGARTLVGVTGCVAQAEGEEIPRRQPLVNLVIGPQAYHQLPEAVAELERGDADCRVIAEFPAIDKFDRLPRQRTARGPTAFLTVQEGCDKFCSFCVVPYTRGAEASRPASEIRAEAERLVAAGVVEITLLGQNVNAYRGPAPRGGHWGLAELIADLAALPDLRRIRYTTSHPRDMIDALIAAHGEIDKLMPYLHLPAQSGSDRVLRAMNRGHTAAHYLDVLERVRQARADIALSGDFIVGFPGETEADFAATLELVDAVGYANAYSFRYSARPGTPAASAPNQVPRRIQSERLQRLQERIGEQCRTFQDRCVGQTMDVLLEKPGRHQGQLVGRSPYLQPVHLTAPDHLRGRIVPVRIRAATTASLSGQLAAA